VYRAKSYTSVFLAGMFLFVPSRHFCCRMYRLATKTCEKNQVGENANASFLRQTIRRALVVLRCLIH